MKTTHITILALTATTLTLVAGCKKADSTTTSPQPPSKTVAAVQVPPVSQTFSPRPRATLATSPKPKPTPTATPTPTPTASKSKPQSSGAKIVSFKLTQKPKCAEGTAVFRAPAVPAVIKWQITGATGAALSVDDNTHTAGTYGPEPLSGTETFTFGCNGPVGSTEKHTYAIYTVGGGKQRSITITATAKVLDKGKS